MSTTKLLREWRSISTAVGEIDVYIVAPEEGSRPAIIMLPEIFGVNEAMRDEAQRFAEQGFSVAIPDLFWRQERKIDLGYDPEGRARGFALMKDYDVAEGVSDLAAAIGAIEDFAEFDGPASIVGFCLGGKLALLVGARTNAPAIISFYGLHLDQNVELIQNYAGVFQFHVGTADTHIPAEAVEAVRAATAGKPDADVFAYEGAGHGFFNRARADIFAPAAAKSALDRVVAALCAVTC